MMLTSTSYTTVSSAPVQNVSDTTTTNQSDTSSPTTTPQMDIPDQTPIHLNNHLNQLILLLLVVLLVVVGLRDQVVDRQVAVDMEEGTK